MKKDNSYELIKDNILSECSKMEISIQKLIKQCEVSLINAPEGKLRIGQSGNCIQYYHRTTSDNKTGKYIHESDSLLAYALAQKDYDERLIRELESELESINGFRERYHPDKIMKIFEDMNPKRQDLIGNHLLTDKEYREQWENKQYEKLVFEDNDDTDFYTVKGERVRSKSEVMIANTLLRYNIPYRYEAPIYLNEENRIYYPDFTCLNVRKRKEIVWEHLGMMGKEDYANKNVKKIEKYILNGYSQGDNLIMTMETYTMPLSTRVIEKMIRQHLL